MSPLPPGITGSVLSDAPTLSAPQDNWRLTTVQISQFLGFIPRLLAKALRLLSGFNLDELQYFPPTPCLF